MLTRIAMVTVSLAAPVLAFVSCTDGQSTPAEVDVPAASPNTINAPVVDSIDAPTSVPARTSGTAPVHTSGRANLTEEITPCSPLTGSAVDPCEPNAEQYAITSGGAGHRRDLGDEPSNMREALEFVPTFLSHIVIRGTYIPRTVRCTAGDPFRPPVQWSDEFVFTANSRAIKCYADVRVGSFVLGNGPAKLTVQIYWYTYFDGEMASIATEEGKTEQEYLEELRQLLETDDYLGGVVGREAMMFLGPATSTSAEAWQVFRIWDVQRRDDDTVIAVHPDRDLWRRFRPDEFQTHLSKLEMELPAFTQAVTTAHQARVTEYEGRVGAGADLPMLVSNVDQLRDYYTAVGAYDTGVPTPAQPPPPCGLAVPDQADNPGLMRDCINLLAAKDTLRGTATLNWSVDTAISDWDGVKVEGSPARVTELNLSSSGLTGTIPPDLGRLDELEFLRLVNNQLTGAIPAELGSLSNLRIILASDNQLTGAIPPELGGLSSLEELWLHRNDLSGEIPATLGDLSNLQDLLLGENRLSGAIPSELGDLSKLEELKLSYNQLTGEIPASLVNLGNLTDLLLGNNQLTGCIPPALRDVEEHDLGSLGLPNCATP